MAIRSYCAVVAVATLCVSFAPAALAQPSPELVARMEKEKADRRDCKVSICKAFAEPAAGDAVKCNVVKTWLRDEITSKIVGGSTIWGYGHMKCTFGVNLDRAEIAKAAASGKANFAEHQITCDVDDKEAGKPIAFTVKAVVAPVVTFEKGEAKSLALDGLKTEGSTAASAAVSSIMAIDKVSGVVSRSGTSEINAFLFDKCKDDGVVVKRP